MKTSRILCIAAFCLLFSLNGKAQTRITSPDGGLVVEVKESDGVVTYRIEQAGTVMVEESALGLVTSDRDMSKGLRITSVGEPKQVSGDYAIRSLKRNPVSYVATRQTVTVGLADGKNGFDVEFHVGNHDVAFRYVVKPGERGRLATMVEREATTFGLPAGALSYNCPTMMSQSGFARTAPSYESRYEYGVPCAESKFRSIVFPALFEVPGKGWVMLSETGVDGRYCGSHLDKTSDNSYAIAYPDAREFGGIGTTAPGISLPAALPWRTITVGTTLRPITETTVMWDVVEEQYAPSQDYQYGRAMWSWIIRMDASCNYDEQKEYIDFAATMGYEYVLIDALWDTNIGYEGIERLSRYAAGKGVGLFLWYNSNGYWNDAPQGPRNKMHRLVDRQKEMAWLQQAGIKGLKIDFIGSDKQQTMQMYEDILADANRYGLMVIFHGCTLPRGWERMYPNFVASEAVRASENLSFDQWENDHEAEAATIHPVLRNAVGNMDFGGTILNKHLSKDNVHGRTRRTSDLFQIATAVLFQTPVQNFALAPNNLTDAPEWAISFMKDVPTTWNDVRFIDGQPGKYLVLARRSGEKWYVAAINAQDQPLNLSKTVISFIAKDTPITVYTDKVQGQDTDQFPTFTTTVQQQKMPRSGKLNISVPQRGAALVVGEYKAPER